MRKRLIAALALTCAPAALAGQGLNPDSLFPDLVDRWVLRGTIARQHTVHDVSFDWLLGRSRSVTGDSISFVFQYTATTSFHTTFIYERQKDSWKWHMDNDSSGA